MNAKIKAAAKALTLSDLVWLFDVIGEVKQMYSFTSETNETMHVDATRLRDALDKGHVQDASYRFMALTDDLYDTILKTQGIEVDHLVNISPDDAAHDPALIYEENSESHVIVDGNHGIVKAFQIGLRRKPAIFVSRKGLEPFLYYPPERVTSLIRESNKENIQFAKVVIEELVNNPALFDALKRELGITTKQKENVNESISSNSSNGFG